MTGSVVGAEGDLWLHSDSLTMKVSLDHAFQKVAFRFH